MTETIAETSFVPGSIGVAASFAANAMRSANGIGIGDRRAGLDDRGDAGDRDAGGRGERLGLHARVRDRPLARRALRGRLVGDPESDLVDVRRPGGQGCIDRLADAFDVADDGGDEVRERVAGKSRRCALAASSRTAG